MRKALACGWQGATKEHSRGSVTEEQRRQTQARALPAGLPLFDAAPALLVVHRSIKDMLTPRVLSHRQIAGNAHVSIYEMGSYVLICRNIVISDIGITR